MPLVPSRHRTRRHRSRSSLGKGGGGQVQKSGVASEGSFGEMSPDRDCIGASVCTCTRTCAQGDRQKDRRQTDRQTDRTDRHTHTEARHTHAHMRTQHIWKTQHTVGVGALSGYPSVRVKVQDICRVELTVPLCVLGTVCPGALSPCTPVRQ